MNSDTEERAWLHSLLHKGMQCSFGWQMCITLRTHISADDMQDTCQFQIKLFFLVVKIELRASCMLTQALCHKAIFLAPQKIIKTWLVKIRNIKNDCQKLLSHFFFTVEFWVSHYGKQNKLGSLAVFRDSKKVEWKIIIEETHYTPVGWRKTFEEKQWNHSRSLTLVRKEIGIFKLMSEWRNQVKLSHTQLLCPSINFTSVFRIKWM